MKKFIDLQVNIGSESKSIEELVAIENKCDGKLFRFDEEIEKLYAQNDKMLHILATVPDMPQAIMLVYASNGTIKVLNVVPFGKGNEALTKTQYNAIVNCFDEKVITPLFKAKYTIAKTSDEVRMEDLIPESFHALDMFVKCPGWPSPFSHPLDRERWCEFICSLNANGEDLSSGDLELWLRDDIKADEKLIEEIIYKYEDATELLEYYDRNYN